tara:strand:- start:26141 stop:26344 length:204 start_codon:yes stop_codon:yes gene_type:complete
MIDYDKWILRGPDEQFEPGKEVGETCGRYEWPYEDAPRGFRPKPCNGVMDNNEGYIICDTCGADADL